MKGTIVLFDAFGNISQIFNHSVPPFDYLPSFFPPSPLIVVPTLTTHPSTKAKQPYDITN